MNIILGLVIIVIVSSLVCFFVGTLVGIENVVLGVKNLVSYASTINPIHSYDINKPQVPFVLQIESVVKGGGAEKAGLLKGDIITAVNGTHISFVSDLNDLKLKANKTVIVSIIRNGKTMQVPVLLSPSVDDPQRGILGILRTQNQAKTP